MTQDTKKNTNVYNYIGLILGIGVAVLYGLFFDNYAFGIAFGLIIGLAVSTAGASKLKKTKKDE